MEFIEAIGLWLITRWGEYFAVIATGIFLPLEIYEITEKVTAFRAIALTINIAAVLWLLWTKRLFGLNGGAAAYPAEHNAATLLAVEQAAAAQPAANRCLRHRRRRRFPGRPRADREPLQYK